MKDFLNTIILSVAILLAVVIYCFSNRYQMVVSASDIWAYEVDRMTGKAWVIFGDGGKVVNFKGVVPKSKE